MRKLVCLTFGLVLCGFIFVAGCGKSEKVVVPEKTVPSPKINPETGIPEGSINLGGSAAPAKE